MTALRITWAELLRAGACVEALPIFQKAAEDHGDGIDIVLEDGWQEEHVRACMKLPGGAFWLHFLEKKEFVPIVESAAKKFPRVLAAQRLALVARMAARITEAKVANL